jgi:hypothetical protein
MARKPTLSNLISNSATQLAKWFGLQPDEAVSAAIANLWDASNAPISVRRWILKRVRRILEYESRKRRRQSAKQPLVDDLSNQESRCEELNRPLRPKDFQASLPEAAAAERELVAELTRMPTNKIEVRTLEYLMGNANAPIGKKEIVAEAPCSPGNAYRAIRHFEKKVEEAVRTHYAG